MSPIKEKIGIAIVVLGVFGLGAAFLYSLNSPRKTTVVMENEPTFIAEMPQPEPMALNPSSSPVPEAESAQPKMKIQAAPPKNRLNNPTSGPHPERYPENLPPNQVYFEVVEGGYAITAGDILMGKIPEEKKDVKVGFFQPPKTKLWPSSTIPFTIAKDIPNPQAIFDAIEYFNTNTSVRFVEAEEGDRDILVFVAIEEHCASHLGRVGGFQPVLISPNCGKTEVMHELMHALGFVHEHSRQDRDRYVEVLWENIQPAFLFQFNKMPDQLVHNYSGSVFDFDPESIMLYPDTAFAKSQGIKTMKSRGRVAMNPKKGELSRADKERIYYLYGR